MVDRPGDRNADDSVRGIPPDLIAQVRRLEIRTRRIVQELFGGEYHSVFKGQGNQFREVREYLAGDDVRAIDWNVTARMGNPFLKQFEDCVARLGRNEAVAGVRRGLDAARRRGDEEEVRRLARQGT